MAQRVSRVTKGEGGEDVGSISSRFVSPRLEIEPREDGDGKKARRSYKSPELIMNE